MKQGIMVLVGIMAVATALSETPAFAQVPDLGGGLSLESVADVVPAPVGPPLRDNILGSL